METLLMPFSPRFIVLTICAVVTALLIGFGIADRKIFDILLIPILIFGALTLLGVRDLLQKSHAVLRNYPISAHIRFLLEEIRPEMRQYFFESEKDGMPFSRDTRAVVYQRAKMQLDKRPFGTQEDVYREGYEWMHHSVSPKAHAEEKFRVVVGGPDCKKPYSASVFNISAMSFGALSPNAVRALNAGAKKGGFAHDTGEGGFSPYHAEMGGDIIWEIGSGYFGCRHLDGSFDPEAFARVAGQDQIKMVELKISQGAKPGHGGVLPAAKVSEEISKIRGVSMGEDCISPASHRAFSTPVGMMQFIAEMRRLSGGKPAGFKLCIGHPWEFLAICKAMLETGIYPDFIVVDGNEGGTGAAPLEFMDHLGMPMREGVNFVHNALIGINARDRIKLGASGKIATAFDMARGDGDRRRLVQFGARLHVLARLHPVAELPHRPLPDRCRDAGPDAGARALRAAQDRPRAQLPPCHAAFADRADRRGRPRTSPAAAPDPLQPTEVDDPGAIFRAALSGAASGRIARRHGGPALPRRLADGAGGDVPAGAVRRRATA
ncbi:glutamate synthase domain-containing protein 2 [Bradyrhizobium diazoefficiens]